MNANVPVCEPTLSRGPERLAVPHGTSSMERMRDVEQLKVVTISGLAGHLSLEACAELETVCINAMRRGASWIVVALERVDYIEPSGIALLARRAQITRAYGGDLKLACISAGVRLSLDYAGFAWAFDICATLEAACERAASRYRPTAFQPVRRRPVELPVYEPPATEDDLGDIPLERMGMRGAMEVHAAMMRAANA